MFKKTEIAWHKRRRIITSVPGFRGLPAAPAILGALAAKEKSANNAHDAYNSS